jgi:predicted ATPase
LIVGPNGSGKTTALSALESVREPGNYSYSNLATSGAIADVILSFRFAEPHRGCQLTVSWSQGNGSHAELVDRSGVPLESTDFSRIEHTLLSSRVYSLEAESISNGVQIVPSQEIARNGYGLAGVFDRMRDDCPERFEALKRELPRWFQEYDDILFAVPAPGARSFALRTVYGAKIPARDLSQGTLLALALLAMAYLPNPPSVIGLEEPDRGIHPRLLRNIRDALYRLSYPESAGDARAPVQVIATTHSPYFLDLFKDHPQEIVIAQKHGDYATFERLSDRPDIDQILDGTSLGDVWYSGILGGVPVAP